MKTDRIYVPWREREFVSVAEAAEILGRSQCWIRDRLLDGRLVAAQHASGGPFLVTVESIKQMSREATTPRPDQLAALRQRNRQEGRPALRIIINNGP